jgi:PAS domain S-box-containing protein
MHIITNLRLYLATHTVWRIAFLAIAYLILGRLSLLLAIPPGYAMAIYPPAGLAVAALIIGGYRLAPSIALGSLCLNLWITWDTQHALSGVAWILATAIAIGAMLQALLGTWLVKRFLPSPLELNHHNDILKFMLLAGPLACLVSASVGISTLVAVGFMPTGEVFSNWLTWWGGDCLGVLVLTPVVFVLFAEPRQLWAGRRYSVMLPQLMILVLMVATYVYVRDWEQNRLTQEFHQRLKSISHTFQARLHAYTEDQKELASVFANFQDVSEAQFTAIATPLLHDKKELLAIEWAPKVTKGERARFEAQHARLLQRDILIRERDAQQTMRVAAERELYFPVLYIAPFAGNEKAFGFDLYSAPDRRLSIQSAVKSQRPVATEPLVVVQETTKKLSVVLMSAVMQTRSDSTTYEVKAKDIEVSDVAANDLNAVSGLIISVLRPGDVLSNLVSAQDKKEIKLKLINLCDRHDLAEVFLDEIGAPGLHLVSRQIIEFGGRHWELQASPSDYYLAQHRPWAAWISLIAGMLFSGLVGMYFLMISGRSFQIEALVIQRTKQLQDSETNRLAILEQAADGILTVSQDGEILSYNRAAEQSLGLAGNALSGISLDQFFMDASGNSQAFAQLIGDSDQASRVLIEVQRQRPDGSILSLELAIAKITQQAQSIYIVVMHDLTERKRVDKIKGEFVSTVSHELRTPLTSIRGSLGLLAGGAIGEIPEKAMNLIKLANSNAERLHQLINDILDFEKLEYGGMLFKLENHRLLDQLKKACEYNMGYAEKFSVELKLEGEQYADMLVNVDDNRLMQVLCNLLSNAIKFSHPHGIVNIVIEPNQEWVRIKVIDHGVGIDSTFSQQIFRKFTQADSSGTRKHAGTGLGLSLAKAMIEKMGGNIGYSSELGVGTTFYIDLKIVKLQ